MVNLKVYVVRVCLIWMEKNPLDLYYVPHIQPYIMCVIKVNGILNV